MNNERKKHWENVYETKAPYQVGWRQEVPQTSLDFIKSCGLKKSAEIIDVGGGDSKLIDHLLDEGFENITVLDISAKAIDKAKQRLGDKAENVNWIVSDILEFEPDTSYDIWHDRATFHFLTSPEEIEKYITIAQNFVTGYLTIGTFSEDGPQKCSGLPVTRYNEETIAYAFKSGFEKMQCIREDHTTPSEKVQNFLFCSFMRKMNNLY